MRSTDWVQITDIPLYAQTTHTIRITYLAIDMLASALRSKLQRGHTFGVSATTSFRPACCAKHGPVLIATVLTLLMVQSQCTRWL